MQDIVLEKSRFRPFLHMSECAAHRGDREKDSLGDRAWETEPGRQGMGDRAWEITWETAHTDRFTEVTLTSAWGVSLHVSGSQRRRPTSSFFPWSRENSFNSETAGLMEQRNSNNNNPPSQMTISPPTASPYAMYPHPSMYPMYYAPSMVSYEMFSAPNAAANTAASIPRNKFMYTQANPTAYTHTMDNTNIYIRGLAPDTTDADLEALCSIYGRILSSKAIVDLKTGICKGFGFAMFETMDMASMALDGLSRQGFLVTFAVQGPRGDSVRVSIVA